MPRTKLKSGKTSMTTPAGCNAQAIDCMAKIPLVKITEAINDLDKKNESTARYLTFDINGRVLMSTSAVCFHNIADNCKGQGVQGLGIFFQGYGGFDTGNAMRRATSKDLLACNKYPFIQIDKGVYNEVSLEWLTAILDPKGPFKDLLPLMYEIDPVAVQARKCFIFPDVSLIPARLTWCFAICSRLGFANARAVWRYLFLRDMGVDNNTSLLMSGGFEDEIRDDKPTGKVIKSYIGGYLGADVTAYAGRFLSSDPVKDQPFKHKHPGTYSSAEVFKSGDMDLKQRTFETWDAAIDYTQRRGVEQSQKLAA